MRWPGVQIAPQAIGKDQMHLSCTVLCGQTTAAFATGSITFNRDVAPILFRHCAGCHHAGDIGPMSLLTYKEVRPWATAINQAVPAGKIPPWKAHPSYGQWSNDPRLSSAAIAVIKAWAEGEKLEGDRKDLPAAPDFNDGWKMGKPDLVISIPEHKLTATGPDEYTDIRVATNFIEDRWIVGAELRLGNRKIVHHAHVFVEKGDGVKRKEVNDPVADFTRWLFHLPAWHQAVVIN